MERRERPPPRVAGRYAIFDAIATGGMASVCFGRLLGPKGFSRTVVIKRLHPQFVGDTEFGAMFLDEARVAARVRHPNVVPVIDVVEGGGEILLVMDYVDGESLAHLGREEKKRDAEQIAILVNVVIGALHGLHAAHETAGENGKPLGIVHRDVSPQNILVGVDGVTRVVDFGIAKAAGQSHSTETGQVKGKVRYLSPEQVMGTVDRQTDVWAAAVVLWEALTRTRLFSGENDAAVIMEILHKDIPSPRSIVPGVPEAVAAAVLRGLERDVAARFPTARAMAEALEEAIEPVRARVVGEWVADVACERLAARRHVLDDIEAETLVGVPNVARRSLPAPPITEMVPPPASARPTLPPPSASPSRAPSRVRALVAIAVACLVVVGFGVRSLVTRRALDADSTATIAAPPDAVAEPLAAAAPSLSVAATPPPITSASAPRSRAPSPSKPRAPASASSHGDFKVPLYGRD